MDVVWLGTDAIARPVDDPPARRTLAQDRPEAAATHRLFTAALESHERRVVVEL